MNLLYLLSVRLQRKGKPVWGKPARRYRVLSCACRLHMRSDGRTARETVNSAVRARVIVGGYHRINNRRMTRHEAEIKD